MRRRRVRKDDNEQREREGARIHQDPMDYVFPPTQAQQGDGITLIITEREASFRLGSGISPSAITIRKGGTLSDNV